MDMKVSAICHLISAICLAVMAIACGIEQQYAIMIVLIVCSICNTAIFGLEICRNETEDK